MAVHAQTVLPRWRGFNLLEAFGVGTAGDFRDEDLGWIADWGFDFVRLPMTYEHWAREDDPGALDESFLQRKIDPVLARAEKHGVHVCLNFHRAPGYTVNSKITEARSLWKDQVAQEAFCLQWGMFARRYRGIPSARLSFNLVNEPPGECARMSRADHERVVRAATAAIRAEDPGRLIIADGISWGNVPCPELADACLAQSCRAYAPAELTHYGAHWVNSAGWPLPAWPCTSARKVRDRAGLEAHFAPWKELARAGVGVHCGEGGAFNLTPHDVVLRWLEDVLDVLGEAGIGFALWNFRGSFGILDSGRSDVAYEDWHGHALDAKLLDLLRRH